MESAENQAQPQSDNESKVEKNTSLSKAQTIALLNESIDRLEETIEKISQDSANVPDSKSLDTLVATTQELEAAVTSTEVKSTTVAAPTVAAPAVPQRSAPKKAAVNPTPKSKAQPKKNTGLIAIAVAAMAIAFVTVFWIWKPQQFANLLPPKTEPNPTPTGIVVAPITDTNTQPLKTSREDTIETIDSPADNVGIVSDISAMDFPPEIEPVAEPIEDVVETVIPEELTSPGRPKNLKMVAIKPKLNFTPEQNLVAALETKVSELVETYPQEYVREVRADLPASSLLVRVTDDWYGLDLEEKDNLGNEILERARDFRFQNLELRDDAGTLVARSPIVGENIIILPNNRE